MVVPDFELICEIMLVAEGFLEARLLARKFITLYTLCKELLSKQVSNQGLSIMISSVESQKGINAVKQCSVENQNGTVAIDIVQW